MKRKLKIAGIIAAVFVSVFVSSCGKSSLVHSLSDSRLFSLKYGNFEDELNLFDLAGMGDISTYMDMRDGFFYIANGEAKKILEFNSYGDLLSLYYNEDYTKNVDFADKNSKNSTKKAVAYPFNTLGPVTVDEKKYIYAVDTLPPERQELDRANNALLKNVVLRFDNSGNFIDYIGQQGPGGTPFSYVKDIYTTKNDELIVVSIISGGFQVFWFNADGFLLYQIPFSGNLVPKLVRDDENDTPMHVAIENIVPDAQEKTLYIKVDYYVTSLDPSLKVQSGIDYEKTLLYPLNVESGKYEEALEIPAYEYSVTENLTKEVYNLPYSFLGVTENGWFFFIIPEEEGFQVQMVQPDGQRIVKRSLAVDHSKILYYTLSLSGNGIISGLFVKNDCADVVWWRTDSLLAALLKN